MEVTRRPFGPIKKQVTALCLAHDLIVWEEMLLCARRLHV